MATSGKSSKSSKSDKSNSSREKGGETRQASTTPVVPSTKVETGGVTVSRIPPSQPIQSGLVGEAVDNVKPAARKATAAKAETATELASRVPSTPPRKPGAASATSAEAPASTSTSPAAQDRKADALPPPQQPGQTTVVKKTGFWPTALGGVVAAALGAGAAYYALPKLSSPAGEQAQQIDADALTTEAVTAATEAARAEIGTLREETLAAATEAATTAGSEAGTAAAQQIIADMPEGADTTTGMQAALQAQADKIAALEAALADRPASAEQATNAAEEPQASADLMAELNSLREQLSAQREEIAALTDRPQINPQDVEQIRQLAAGAESVKAEIDAVASQAQEQLAAVQSEADAATQRAQAVASVAAIGAALERGGSPEEAVQQLEEAGIDVPEPLAVGDLPTLDQIQTEYDAASRAALRASLEETSGEGGAIGAVGTFLRMQTGARSVEPREGDDPDAVLSRAGAFVAKGELTIALDELSALPPAGQDAIADWKARAEAYIAAQTALNDVATTLN
ncbi:COG4223 family protein [Paracoccus sp. SCSIO 75233]|uniref:COG4223 family protein n=1 Tax=Paracoccus sp. SCSIO 75233 TaxID=3017782 RepID=UPI0022F0B8AF|nr:hypothetical protein [Paracoccus sp. SCSIO 75233]WBU53532.1 hypothetical protein PAF12_01435 [Paracoccus sp. SCSIO 75233]